MNLPNELTTVSHFSKGLAMGIFILMPFVGFLSGIKYQTFIESASNSPITAAIDPDISSSSSKIDWKIYTNKNLNFRISYPSTWAALETEPISTVTFRDSMSEAYVDLHLNFNGGFCDSENLDCKEEAFSVNGLDGKKYTTSSDSYFVFPFTSKNTYNIFLIAHYVSEKDTADKIISSLSPLRPH